MSDNEIEDVSPLVGLKKLTTLDLSSNKINGIAVLKDAFADGTITTITLTDNADIPYEDWDVLSEAYPKATITGKPSSAPEESSGSESGDAASESSGDASADASEATSSDEASEAESAE